MPARRGSLAGLEARFVGPYAESAAAVTAGCAIVLFFFMPAEVWWPVLLLLAYIVMRFALLVFRGI